MIIVYKILYKNGVEDVFKQVVTEENEEKLLKINDYVQEAFLEGSDGILSFGDGETGGSFIRLADVRRVGIETILGDEFGNTEMEVVE